MASECDHEAARALCMRVLEQESMVGTAADWENVLRCYLERDGEREAAAYHATAQLRQRVADLISQRDRTDAACAELRERLERAEARNKELHRACATECTAQIERAERAERERDEYKRGQDEARRWAEKWRRVAHDDGHGVGFDCDDEEGFFECYPLPWETSESEAE